MSDDEETLIEEARSYVHPDSAHALYLIGALADALESANALLAARDQALDEIKALHSGFRIYDPCDCGHSDEAVLAGDAVDTGEFIACEETYLYSICRECCTCGDDDEQTECCVDHHAHAANPPICETQRILTRLDTQVETK